MGIMGKISRKAKKLRIYLGRKDAAQKKNERVSKRERERERVRGRRDIKRDRRR